MVPPALLIKKVSYGKALRERPIRGLSRFLSTRSLRMNWPTGHFRYSSWAKLSEKSLRTCSNVCSTWDCASGSPVTRTQYSIAPYAR